MSRRWAACSLFAIAVAVLAVNAPTRGQVATFDTVTYFDRKTGKRDTVTAAIKKESPAGVEVPSDKTTRLIPVQDIIRVDYGGLPGAAEITQARQFEDFGDPAELPKSREKYASALKSAGASDKAKRFLTFREAMVAAKLTDLKREEKDFQAEAERTAKLLSDFLVTYDKTWELWPASRTLARFQMELGKFDDAAKTLARLSANPDLPAALQHEAKLAEASATIRGGSPSSADPILAALEKDAKFEASGPLRQRLNVLKVAAKFPKPDGGAKPADAAAVMEKAIGDASDPSARAVGYAHLGDYYKANNLPRDAMWAYLWVDVVYAQEKDERVVALRRLAEVFDGLGDAERATQFREKLPTVR